MKYHVEMDEFWAVDDLVPVGQGIATNRFRPPVEIPDELVERFRKVHDEWQAVQEELPTGDY